MSNNLVAGTFGMIVGVSSLNVQSLNIQVQPALEILQSSLGVLAYGVLGGVAGVIGKFIAVWAIKKIKQKFNIKKDGK